MQRREVHSKRHTEIADILSIKEAMGSGEAHMV